MLPLLATTALTPFRVRSTQSAAVAGLSATNFPIAPNIQWHAGQSTATMRADTAITGYIVGNTLTVTAITGGAILEGQVLKTGAAAGTRIVKAVTGVGGTGNYIVSISQNVYSSGAPGAFTIGATQVATLTDLKGNANLTSADGEAPRLMDEISFATGLPTGRKFLRFIMPTAFVGSWLQNLTISGIDTHNFASVCVAKVHTPAQMVIVSPGARNNSTGNTQWNLGIRTSGLVSVQGVDPDWNGGSPPANLNKLLAGSQLQVIGAATVTDDGPNGSTTNTNASRVGVNEQSAAITVSGTVRTINITGLEIGKNSSQATNINAANYAFVDIYELALWTTGQFGTRAQMPARFDAAMAAAQANYNIPAITDNLVLLGDSRSVNGTAAQAGQAADGSGYNLATLLAEYGNMPASTRIFNLAISGQGIGFVGSFLNRTVNANNRITALTTTMMLGGGRDKVHLFSGTNDLTTRWPNDNFAANTVGIANEMYGTDRTASATVTFTNNSNSMAYTGLSGPIAVGSLLSFTNALSGLAVTTASATPATTNLFQTPAVTSVAATMTLNSYKSIVNTLLTRGWKVVWAAETWQAATQTAGTAQLRTRIAGAVADVTADIGSTLAANLRVYDLSLISQGGQQVFGTNYVGGSSTNDKYVDGLHMTTVGKRLLISGGDTPANGVLANVLAA